MKGFIINKNGVSVEKENITTIKLKINCSEYLPEIMKERFMKSYELSDENAELITINKETASFFEEVLSYEVSPKNAVNWITGDLFALLNKNDTNISESKVNPKHIAEIIQNITGHKGKIIWDSSKPDGTPRKLLDTSRLSKIGWKYSTELELGIEKTYKWFLKNIDSLKKIKL